MIDDNKMAKFLIIYKNKVLFSLLLGILLGCLPYVSDAKKKTAVYLVAGQSNTDGRVNNDLLPDDIKRDKYHFCHWSFGSGRYSGNGKFEIFWPHIYDQKQPARWAYDAVVYYWLEQSLKRDFYIIKESLGGTAIDTRAVSRDSMYRNASPAYLASTSASDKGGKSLLKAFTENICACIDNELSHHPHGYDIKALMWHQGESDSRYASSYYENLKAVIAYVRKYLVGKTGKRRYVKLPVLIGGISHASQDYRKEVEAAQRRLAQEDRDVYLIEVPDASLQSDHLHFDAEGAELLGRKMYEQLRKLHLAK